MDKDRRTSPRYPLIADVEVTIISSNTKLKARTTDISMNGCFLDMLNPAPKDSEVRVTISHAGKTFVTVGKVALAVSNLGMGVGFTNIEPNQAAILQQWISEAGGTG